MADPDFVKYMIREREMQRTGRDSFQLGASEDSPLFDVFIMIVGWILKMGFCMVSSVVIGIPVFFFKWLCGKKT